MDRIRAFRHLLEFHLRTGGRVALRTLAPVAGGAIVAAVLGGSHMAVIGPVAAVAFPERPSVGGALATAAILWAVAATVAPRLVAGMTGWSRHLPVRGADQRRALTAGVVMAIVPVLLLVGAAGAVSLTRPDPEPHLARLLGLPLLAWGVALAALPLAWRWRLLALASAVLAATGSWWPVPVGLALLAWSERKTDALGSHVVRPIRSRAGGPSRPGMLWLRIAVRSLGARPAGAWALGAAILLPAWLLVVNNDLELARRLLVVRFSALLAVVVVVATTAETLVVRRPPWPWVRSLPWSARRRCALEGALLAALALPVVLPVALVETRAVVVVLPVLPWLAVRAVAAIRGDRRRSTGAAGQLLAEGALAAGLAALVPWLAVVAVGLTPLALSWAVEAERSQDVSRWHELHHLAAGDPLSWEDR